MGFSCHLAEDKVYFTQKFGIYNSLISLKSLLQKCIKASTFQLVLKKMKNTLLYLANATVKLKVITTARASKNTVIYQETNGIVT